jgi:hypothetical protein
VRVEDTCEFVRGSWKLLIKYLENLTQHDLRATIVWTGVKSIDPVPVAVQLNEYMELWELIPQG